MIKWANLHCAQQTKTPVYKSYQHGIYFHVIYHHIIYHHIIYHNIIYHQIIYHQIIYHHIIISSTHILHRTMASYRGQDHWLSKRDELSFLLIWSVGWLWLVGWLVMAGWISYTPYISQPPLLSSLKEAELIDDNNNLSKEWRCMNWRKSAQIFSNNQCYKWAKISAKYMKINQLNQLSNQRNQHKKSAL